MNRSLKYKKSKRSKRLKLAGAPPRQPPQPLFSDMRQTPYSRAIEDISEDKQ
jgi:hypothetical protein